MEICASVGQIGYRQRMMIFAVTEKGKKMSYWNAKYTNDRGEYEITFASNRKEKTKAVEKFCQAIIDQKINVENATDILEQLIKAEPVKHGRWEYVEYQDGVHPVYVYRCTNCGVEKKVSELKYLFPYLHCFNCGAKMDMEGE